MAGSLLSPPQITVWDSFLGLHPGFLLLFHPPAPQSIYLSTHKYLSYQLISINLSLSKLALISFFSVNWSLSNLPWPNIHLWTDQPLSNLSLSNLPLSALSLRFVWQAGAWCVLGRRSPLFALRGRCGRLVTFSCVVSNWCLSNLPLSSFLRQNYLYPTYLYQTYFCQTFSPSLSLSLKLIFNLSDLLYQVYLCPTFGY